MSEGTPAADLEFADSLGPQDWDDDVFAQIDALVNDGERFTDVFEDGEMVA